ncbi:MAG TPA: N-acetylglutaminylglutamine synthetase [Xanthomonadaceae bacterium]|nr:N-acetylglutaminylglutamine synthetase [Xanthomonadaceae bacterium]
MNEKTTRRPRGRYAHRLERLREPRLRAGFDRGEDRPQRNAWIDCGWGRLLFAHTFDDVETLAAAMREEGTDRRDIAFYVPEPHVLLAAAPQDLFLDPSHTYRLDLSTYRAQRAAPRGYFVRRLCTADDAEAANRLYATLGMVAVPPDFFWSRRGSRALTYLVAENPATGEVIGTVTGINHVRAFGDPQKGSSLWCLAVDPTASQPGIGEALVRALAEHFAAQALACMDLSVLHDNEPAIALYEKLGFKRVPVYAVKRKNPINEKLFTGPELDEGLNPYAQIIVDEARRRGIAAEIVDAEGGFFRLNWGGRSVLCRESLSELTSGVAVSICDDKAVTRRLVERAGLRVPAQIEAADPVGLRRFLAEHGAVVVKPARGEQGRGVTVGVTSVEGAEAAIELARRLCDRVLVEQFVEGDDLRLVVIDYALVAAALRRPATVVGDGRTSVRELIERQSRRRAAATGGESRIPLDGETRRCVSDAGYRLEDVPDAGVEIRVRRTANLHTGGTLHDVTDTVHPELAEAAVAIATAIGIPVVGIDFIVQSPARPDYVFIEANERPGLANHEPQPTAERFVDLLFARSGAPREAASD